MTISNKLLAILEKEFGYKKDIHNNYHIRRAEKALTTLIHKEVLAGRIDEIERCPYYTAGTGHGYFIKRIAELTEGSGLGEV